MSDCAHKWLIRDNKVVQCAKCSASFLNYILELEAERDQLQEQVRELEQYRHHYKAEDFSSMESTIAQLQERAQAVVIELQDCWEHTPNKLEFIIGELADLLPDRSKSNENKSR